MNKNRNVKMCIAKKDYRCNWCNCKIPKGTKYFRDNVNYSGVYHFCNKDCADAYFSYDHEAYLCDDDDV